MTGETLKCTSLTYFLPFMKDKKGYFLLEVFDSDFRNKTGRRYVLRDI